MPKLINVPLAYLSAAVHFFNRSSDALASSVSLAPSAPVASVSSSFFASEVPMRSKVPRRHAALATFPDQV